MTDETSHASGLRGVFVSQEIASYETKTFRKDMHAISQNEHRFSMFQSHSLYKMNVMKKAVTVNSHRTGV